MPLLRSLLLNPVGNLPRVGGMCIRQINVE